LSIGKFNKKVNPKIKGRGIEKHGKYVIVLYIHRSKKANPVKAGGAKLWV